MYKTITSRDNPVIKHTARLVADKALRREEALFVCEGSVMLEEALRSGAGVRAALRYPNQVRYLRRDRRFCEYLP